MSENRKYPPPAGISAAAWIDQAQYERLYAASIADPETFWAEQARRELEWITPFTKVKDCSFAADDLHIRWFEDGELNVAANCLDRHLETRGAQTAIIWESDDGSTTRTITYRELHGQVSRFANALTACGAKKGDRITRRSTA
jgi:acetyl-CoA synthetase